MFLIKKIVLSLFSPLTLCLIIMIWGLLLLWFTKRQMSGKVILSAGVLIMALLSYGTVSDPLLRPLERTFPPLTIGQPHNALYVRQAKWIVVLGGGHTSDPGLPVTSQISFESLARLTEAVRLYRTLPEAKLILSGGAVFDPLSEAEILSRTAQIMGVSSRDIIISDKGRDTEEEVHSLDNLIGKDPFLLVTSALHMPRAMALFTKRGMNAMAAPAAYFVKDRPESHPRDYFPSATGLLKTQKALHELLGMAWLRMTGRI